MCMINEKGQNIKPFLYGIISFVMIFINFLIIVEGFNFIIKDTDISFQLRNSARWFNLMYVLGFTMLIYLIPLKIKKQAFSILFSFVFLYSLIQIIYYKNMNNYFGISDFLYTNEGKDYLLYALGKIDIEIICYIIVAFVFFLITLRFLKYSNKNIASTIVVILLALYYILFGIVETDKYIGKDFKIDEKNNFDGMVSRRSIYNTFFNRKEAFNISGLYHYVVRDIYLFMKNSLNNNQKNELMKLSDYFKENIQEKEINNYTGLLEGENVIFILLESIDSWLVDEMKTLSYLKNNGLDFTNRYAPFFGGGRTFNTEFAVNTGYYIPNNYNIYESINNNYPFALPRLFREKGYTANSIHYNRSSFYNRKGFHKTYGYEHFYSLYDMGYKDTKDDSNLVNNEAFDSMLKSPFMIYFITYSAHLPYQNNDLCSTNSSYECIRELAKLTDDFLKELLIKLNDKKLLDKTTIVLFTDHYAYGYDINSLITLKELTDSNDLNIEKVPFIIWSKKLQAQKIDKIMGTIDIYPTICNLFNLDYNPSFYIGKDVLSDKYKGLVYFQDYTYIGETGGKNIASLINLNDSIIKYNYFKQPFDNN